MGSSSDDVPKNREEMIPLKEEMSLALDRYNEIGLYCYFRLSKERISSQETEFGDESEVFVLDLFALVLPVLLKSFISTTSNNLNASFLSFR